MTTPAHAALSLIVLGRSERNALPVALGAVAPDAPMLVFYLWERLVRGVSEGRIWSERYFDPGWQVVFEIPSSIPLLALALCILLVLLGRRSTGRFPAAGVAATPRPARLTAATLFVASMILHALGDLPLHREDAHRHFFPVSDWRFTSPVSYWDPGALRRVRRPGRGRPRAGRLRLPLPNLPGAGSLDRGRGGRRLRAIHRLRRADVVGALMAGGATASRTGA